MNDLFFLPKAKKTGYICPICNNGAGSDGDGLVLDRSDKTQSHYKCFKCGFYGDTVDLVGIYYGLEDQKDKFNKYRELYGIDKEEQKRTFSPRIENEEKTDYSEFIEAAKANNDYKYLLSRGISEETQRKFNIGYVAEWKSPKAVKTVQAKGGNPANLPTSPRVIIPRNKYNYLARDTRTGTDLTDEQKKFVKQNEGKTSLFNIGSLNKEVCFVTEGEIDAMSIEEAGGNACGLCSTANRRSFIEYLKKQGTTEQCFVLMLDNDEAGQRAGEELGEELERLGLPSLKADYKGKDPNEALLEDPEGFKAIIEAYKDEAKELIKDSKGNQYKAADLISYFENIENEPYGIEAKTGFEDLDANLQGGLFEGLYILGAISSLGKTTFSLQLADQIAERGQDVIFFSLEMSKYELIAKSISRISYDIAREAKTKDGRFIARDTAQVLNNRRYKYYTNEEKGIIKDSIEAYKEKTADHLYIYEGRYKGERLGVKHIREIVKNHIASTGAKPVIFIDYLQILAPADPKQTDKQATDANVFELKEISRDYNIPVFVISSFNRENYNEPVSMTSFKESGAVEYSSDVLLALQFSGYDYIDGESDKDRRRRIRQINADVKARKKNKQPIEVELKCLKQRNGYNFSMCFYLVNAFNHYECILGREAFRREMGTNPFEKEEIL